MRSYASLQIEFKKLVLERNKMSDSVVIFINKDAVKLEDLFLNENWCLSEIFERVYSISVGNKKLKWLVKIYDKKKYAKRESENLNRLKKVPGIPRILAVGFSEQLNYVILSQASGMDLFEYIENHHGVLSEEEVKIITKQLLTTLKAMHSHNIIHKDIKPENIIYDKSSKMVTLIDFEEKYTDDYRSPEQVHGKNLSEKTDIWSLGVTLYFLMVGDVPFQTEKEILRKQPTFSSKWSEDFKDFMGCLLERDINLRYSAKEALEHIWMTN